MKEEDIKKLSKKELQNIVLKMQNMMSDKQKEEFQKIVEASGIQSGNCLKKQRIKRWQHKAGHKRFVACC